MEKVFIGNLRKYRTLAKLSQERVSALVDRNINYINIIESGKSMPPISMIQKIAAAIGVKPSALFEADTSNAIEQFTERRKTAEDIAQEISLAVSRILCERLCKP